MSSPDEPNIDPPKGLSRRFVSCGSIQDVIKDLKDEPATSPERSTGAKRVRGNNTDPYADKLLVEIIIDLGQGCPGHLYELVDEKDFEEVPEGAELRIGEASVEMWPSRPLSTDAIVSIVRDSREIARVWPRLHPALRQKRPIHHCAQRHRYERAHPNDSDSDGFDEDCHGY